MGKPRNEVRARYTRAPQVQDDDEGRDFDDGRESRSSAHEARGVDVLSRRRLEEAGLQTEQEGRPPRDEVLRRRRAQGNHGRHRPRGPRGGHGEGFLRASTASSNSSDPRMSTSRPSSSSRSSASPFTASSASRSSPRPSTGGSRWSASPSASLASSTATSSPSSPSPPSSPW